MNKLARVSSRKTTVTLVLVAALVGALVVWDARQPNTHEAKQRARTLVPGAAAVAQFGMRALGDAGGAYMDFARAPEPDGGWTLTINGASRHASAAAIDALLAELELGEWVRDADVMPLPSPALEIDVANASVTLGAATVDGQFAMICIDRVCREGVVGKRVAELAAPSSGFVVADTPAPAVPTAANTMSFHAEDLVRAKTLMIGAITLEHDPRGWQFLDGKTRIPVAFDVVDRLVRELVLLPFMPTTTPDRVVTLSIDRQDFALDPHAKETWQELIATLPMRLRWETRTAVNLSSLTRVQRTWKADREVVCRGADRHWRLCEPTGELDENEAALRLEAWSHLVPTHFKSSDNDNAPRESIALQLDDRPPLQLFTDHSHVCWLTWPGETALAEVPHELCDERLGSRRLLPPAAEMRSFTLFDARVARVGVHDWTINERPLSPTAADALDAALSNFFADRIVSYHAHALTGPTQTLGDLTFESYVVAVPVPVPATLHGWTFVIAPATVEKLRAALRP